MEKEHVPARPDGPLDGKKLALQVVDAARCLLDEFLTQYNIFRLNHLIFECFQDREVLVDHEIHQGVEDKARTVGEKTLCGEIV